MSLKIQNKKLGMIANDFYRATGIQLVILDTELNHIASAGLNDSHFCDIIQKIDNNISCMNDDKYILEKCTLSHKPEMHICHAGLIDIAVPIAYEQKILGFLIMGRMRRNISFDELGFGFPQKYEADLREKYNDIPIYSEEQAMSILSLASMLASYIIMEDMIVREPNNISDIITKYIRENLHKNISVTDICKNVGISKNTLNRNMRRFVGMSAIEYIMQQRMELAKKLLLHTNDSISAICEQIGVSDTSYFCRVFKKSTGTTPTKYRKG